MNNIGIDIGGTFIKSAIVDEKGKIVLSGKTPTPPRGEEIPRAVTEAVYALLKSASMKMEDISTIGIGTTGICDSKRGIIKYCPNIEGYENINICEYVSEKTGKETFLDNDANCAALGEFHVSGKYTDNFVFVTLGTGVGGGIILNGKILRGINGGAGEIGHMTLIKDGERCNCGRYGCWERYASVSALTRQTKEAGFTGNVNGKTVFEESLKGDENAQRVLDRWISYVAEGVCNIVNIFQPDMVVIGGGVSREGDRILKPVEKFVAENIMTKNATNIPQCKIEISKLFNDAGVIGASLLYTQK